MKKNNKGKAKTKTNANTVLPAVPKYTISKKKQEDLFYTVHEEIMKVRIKISLGRARDVNANNIQELLSGLCLQLPQKALDVFKA